MSRLYFLATGCGIFVVTSLLLVGWALGVSIGQSPREVTEQMIGVTLPKDVRPEVRFEGLLGSVPINVEYEAHVRFLMSSDDLEAFVNRLGCPYPTKENRYECNLTYWQSSGGHPPTNGTAESRLFQFKLREDNTVLVQMRLLST
ncbi:hypothetical protein HJG54_26995 [Leptolyngbya sp. NK1-12]|uniref:Uncharacterized protein n=1 Tax=Leptolyngbya sp. NK1-12 TaxID=2547451 RepID=A0AA97AJ04_9CYAN|nr:hypothetical protein [Leptolyngbya sp. NK1-12]WNZ26114.1 hypothetical protein HJG54_26995 [Leptolyngbya sp. NK1-12]